MLIDTHAHLFMLDRRGIDIHKTLAKLFSEGLLAGIIDVSLKAGDLQFRIKEFSCYDGVRFADGLWPLAASIADRERLVKELESGILAVKQHESAPKEYICALGEFGLDRRWNNEDDGADIAGERELMEMQMDLAQRLNLPVIIHSRDAAEETAEILARYPQVRGVIHCFSYNREAAKTFLDLGYFISFAGNISYRNAGTIQDACKFTPLDRLLLETDCPYLAPVPYRGKPAHPGMVEECYKLAAEIRGINIKTMAEHIAENIKELFGIDLFGN